MEDLINLRSRFINVQNTQELLDTLADLLPLRNEDYKVDIIQGSVKKFTCKVNCQIENVKEFINGYNEKSKETLRLRSTKSQLGPKNKFERYVYLRCQHNTRYHGTMNAKAVMRANPSKRFKNTDCPFSLILKFKKDATESFNCLIYFE